MAAKKNLKGIRFGKLVGLYEDGRTNDGRIAWLFQCDCGNIKRLNLGNIRQAKSCGCRRLSMHLLPGDGGSFNQCFDSYRCNAAGKKLDFSLTKKEFRKITSRSCRYCGTEPQPYYARNRSIVKVIPYICNGIDRVDNSVGYLFKNCVPCCKICNYMKRGLSVSAFLTHIQKISSYPEVL